MAPNSVVQLGVVVVYFSLCLLTVSAISVSDVDDPPSVYDVLPQFGLPSGLLPDSVKSYTLESDGRFVVELHKHCYVHFDYVVYYETRITGQLDYGSITQLEGIQVQSLWLWFDVNEIRVDLPPSNSIYFQVGLINKKLGLEQFKTIHSCKPKLSDSCGESLNRVFELPTPMDDDIQFLVTE